MRTVGLGAEKSTSNEEKLLGKIAGLEKENADLKDEIDSLKKKSKSSTEKRAKTEQDKNPEKE